MELGEWSQLRPTVGPGVEGWRQARVPAAYKGSTTNTATGANPDWLI